MVCYRNIRYLTEECRATRVWSPALLMGDVVGSPLVVLPLALLLPLSRTHTTRISASPLPSSLRRTDSTYSRGRATERVLLRCAGARTAVRGLGNTRRGLTAVRASERRTDAELISTIDVWRWLK